VQEFVYRIYHRELEYQEPNLICLCNNKVVLVENVKMLKVKMVKKKKKFRSIYCINMLSWRLTIVSIVKLRVMFLNMITRFYFLFQRKLYNTLIRS